MDNSEITEIIALTGKLLDLHDQDEMRSKAYLGAVFNLDREQNALAKMSEKDLLKIRGVGTLMIKNIQEIVETGELQELQELIRITPVGVFDLFKIKGLGVKKIKALWKELHIENLKDLKTACETGVIAKQKGFGEKTQDAILASMDFILAQEGKLRIDKAWALSLKILNLIKESYEEVIEVGQVVRKCEVVDVLQFMVVKDGFGGLKLPSDYFYQDMKISSPNIWRGFFKESRIKVEIEKVAKKDFVNKQFIRNSSEEHLKIRHQNDLNLFEIISNKNFENEAEIYKSLDCNRILPEMREGLNEFEWIKKHSNDELVSWDKFKGTVHNHSTYSDGKNTLKEMAEACQNMGLQFFGIADHSQSAQYAGGLWPDTVKKQHAEIDALNFEFENFRILKGIESDILANGDLDYEEDVLKSFDYVVASVHSGLFMDIEKATTRLIRAIENPYISILGHLSGRLLLSRNGYPLDYKKVIDACAANKVIMEINASPYRLDIDWRYVPYCLEKEVMLSINPDAHAISGLNDMHYGIAVARKGGLTSDRTLNCMQIEEVLKLFSKK